MIMFFVKRYLRKCLKALVEKYQRKIVDAVPTVELYEAKLLQLIHVLDNIKAKVKDGVLTDEEANELIADGEKLIDEIFKKEK